MFKSDIVIPKLTDFVKIGTFILMQVMVKIIESML